MRTPLFVNLANCALSRAQLIGAAGPSSRYWREIGTVAKLLGTPWPEADRLGRSCAAWASPEADPTTSTPTPTLVEQNDPFGYVLADFNHGRGHRWSRRGWNSPGQFIELQIPDEHSKMTLPYIVITTVQGDRVPWLPSQTDLLANDWYIV